MARAKAPTRVLRRTRDRVARDQRAALRTLRAQDSFQNFAVALGIGTDNAMSASTYGFNPITRVRTLLEWIHRGSWIGGMAIDVIADDMTKGGIDIHAEVDPSELERLGQAVTRFGVWNAIRDTVAWARLYGGAIGVMLIDGQNPQTPLRVEAVGRNSFRGLLVLDRWMVDPSLEDLVDEPGPYMGTPRYYRVNTDAPGLRGKSVHYSRCLRLEGIRLPWWQRIQENLWGVSVLERIYDRMVAFDSATTGAAQLVYRSHLRTINIKGLREAIAVGGPAYQALLKFVTFMRQTQSNEGITLLDGEDTFNAHQSSVQSGISEALLQFAQQLSGALQIPLVRLLGQSPAGLSATGESDLRMYYDGIQQQQEQNLRVPLTSIYRVLAASEGVALGEQFGFAFNPLWQLDDKEKSETSERDTRSVLDAEERGIVSQQMALKELRDRGRPMGRWTHIDDETIEAASDEIAPRGEEAIEQGLGPDGQPLPPDPSDPDAEKTPLEPNESGLERREASPRSGTSDARPLTGWIERAHGVPFWNERSQREIAGSCWFVVTTNARGEEDTYARSPTNACKTRAEAQRKLDEWQQRAGPRARIVAKDSMPTGEVMGIPVVIECPAGRSRWHGAPPLPADYGYVRRTASAEGPEEAMDIIVGTDRYGTRQAFVADQYVASTGEFDEHKVLMGFLTKEDAIEAWRGTYPDGRVVIGDVTPLDYGALRSWLRLGDVRRPLGRRGPRAA